MSGYDSFGKVVKIRSLRVHRDRDHIGLVWRSITQLVGPELLEFSFYFPVPHKIFLLVLSGREPARHRHRRISSVYRLSFIKALETLGHQLVAGDQPAFHFNFSP